MAHIEGECAVDELDVKRFYLPGLKVKDNCPSCGKECERNMGQYYLSYPTMNRPETLTMYCSHDGCGHEWKLSVIVRIGLELAK